jgi:hypothetical protein
MRILLDNGIYTHAEFAVETVSQNSVRWGESTQLITLCGLTRKAQSANPDFERQKEALFTIGRLMREKQIDAYEYWEITFEKLRDHPRIPEFNALRGCSVAYCDSAVHRSKFRKTRNFNEACAKGGKKDRLAGFGDNDCSQVPFMEWLNSLSSSDISKIIGNAKLLGLTDFEIESLRSIVWFQFLCQRSGSRENYPDIFHWWTAERNGLDALLTLDYRLVNLARSVKKECRKPIQINSDVFLPLDLLNKLEIREVDPVPMEQDRLYGWHEAS